MNVAVLQEVIEAQIDIVCFYVACLCDLDCLYAGIKLAQLSAAKDSSCSVFLVFICPTSATLDYSEVFCT